MTDAQDSTQASASSGSPSTPQSGAVSVQQIKNQLTNKFQSNKVLVLKAHSILSWEQDIYALYVFSIVSLAFIVIHLVNSSLLTTLSYIGIFGALIDLALPSITKNLNKNQAVKQTVDTAKFDKICLDLARVIAFFRGSCDSCCSLKTRKPKIYYAVLLISLLILAFVGNKFNNLFLTYVTILFAAIYPGLDRKGLPQKIVDFVCQKLGKKSPQISGSFTSNISAGGDRRSSSSKRN